jgi:transporter family-2 protein
VSGGTALAVTLVAVAGVAGSVQAAVMGELGARTSIAPAVAFSTLVSVAAGVAALAIAERSFSGLRAVLREPAWLWIGGLLSVFIVLAVTVAPPRIGTTGTIAVVITTNLAMAALIDRYGWFGQEQIAVTWQRLAGLALLAGGTALILWRT